MMIFLFALISLCSGSPEADAAASVISHGYDAGPYCANGGYCVPPVACAPWYLTSLYDSAAACYLARVPLESAVLLTTLPVSMQMDNLKVYANKYDFRQKERLAKKSSKPCWF